MLAHDISSFELIPLWKKIIETSGAKIYGLAMSTLAFILVARLLGPEGKGIVAATYSWVGLFATIGCLSLGQVAQYKSAQKTIDNWFPNTFGALIILSPVLSIITLLTAGGLYYFTDGSIYGYLPLTALGIGFLALPFRIWEQSSTALLTALDRLRVYNKFQIIGKTGHLFSVLLLVAWLKWGVIGALLAGFIAQVTISCSGLNTFWLTTKYKLIIDWYEIKDLLKGGAKLHLNAIGAYLFNQSDILVLNHYAIQKSEVGWYQLAYQLLCLLLIVPQTASMVLYSRMSKTNPDSMWPEQKKIGFQILWLLLFVATAAYFMAPSVIPFLAGVQFHPSIRAFRWLLPAVIGMTFSIIMANQWIGRGFFGQAALITITSALVNLALNLLLIPRYGMMGAIYATLISYLGIYVPVNLIMAIYCEWKSQKLLLIP
ncbi:MAG: lipopolysaccharide biosynthesis protein [Promethearchaeota archaeon]|jgi:O-antigen/teichoic acid export membrane protein